MKRKTSFTQQEQRKSKRTKKRQGKVVSTKPQRYPLKSLLDEALNAAFALGATQSSIAIKAKISRTNLNSYINGHKTITVATGDRILSACRLVIINAPDQPRT